MKQGWVLYELCLLLPLEKMIGMELSGYAGLNYGLDISRNGYKGVTWESHEFKIIGSVQSLSHVRLFAAS